MSNIKLKKIISFSSQDEVVNLELNSNNLLSKFDQILTKVFKADNLLSKSSSKWIGSKSGDTKQYVVVEFEEASQIHQIEIQNESSAFIEILVSNTENEDDFEVILPAVSFMTPNESKNSLNTSRSKFFTYEDSLIKNLCDEKKWKYAKIVCTQPFNHDLQFGIASIRFYNKIVLTDESKEALKIKTGVFGLKKESLKIDEAKLNDNKTDETIRRSIFDEWKKNEETKKETEENEKEVNSIKSNDRKREETKPETSKVQNQSNNNTNSRPTTSNHTNNSNKRDYDSNKSNNNRQQILRGVIFALSGFQNPLRSELRDKGIKLGAKYRPDWTHDCTHLVCAFANTPKAYQVKQLDDKKIVTKDWLYECEKERKLLDENDFKLESEDESDDDTTKPRKAAKNAQKQFKKLSRKDEFDDSYDEEEAENSDDKDFIVNSSEEEEDDYKMMSVSSTEEEDSESFDSDDSERVRKKKTKKSNKKAQKRIRKVEKKKTVVKAKKQKKKSSSSSSSSTSSESDIDLEDYKRKKEKEIVEMNRKKQHQQQPLNEINENKSVEKKLTSKSKKKGIVYENDEDDEAKTTSESKNSKLKKIDSNRTEINSDSEYNKNKNVNDDDDSWELPTFFQEKNFYLYGDFNEKQRKQLTRLIIAFDGKVNDYMSEEVDYVITDKSEWTSEFEQSRKDVKSDFKIINSDWISACNKRKKLVAFQPYEICPDV